MKSDSTLKDDKIRNEISLKEIYLELKNWWRYLLSKWITIVIFGVLGGALGFAYAYLKKPVYSATTTFVLEEDQSNGGGLGSIAGIASIAGFDLGGGGGGIFQGDNILELYKSRRMIEKTLFSNVDINGKKQLLINRYIDFNNLKKNWAEKPELKNLTFYENEYSESDNYKSNRLKDSVIGLAVKDINDNYLKVTKPNDKLSIIKAEVISKDEIFSKTFNEQIVKNVNDFYVQTKTKKSTENVAILQHKTDSVRRVMNGAIYTSVKIADATPNLNPTRQVQRVAPAQKAQFSAETNKSILSERVKNLEMSKMASLREIPLIQVIDYPIYPLQKSKLGKAKGIVLGGIIGGLLTIMFLSTRLLFRNVLS